MGFNIFNRQSIIIKSKFIFIPPRLLSWAGQQIEPYGIDFILNKLGFSHARTTIPKWLQRGFMDPLDKLQSLFIMQLLLIVEENKNQEEAENSKKHEQKK
jgi:hypothetical protein